MRLLDGTKQAVHLQRSVFESMDERDAFYAGEVAAIDPERISEFTYERLNCGLLVNTGRNYVAKALLTSESDGRPLDAQGIARAFADITLQRMADLRIIGERDHKQRAQIERWLGTKRIPRRQTSQKEAQT